MFFYFRENAALATIDRSHARKPKRFGPNKPEDVMERKIVKEINRYMRLGEPNLACTNSLGQESRASKMAHCAPTFHYPSIVDRKGISSKASLLQPECGNFLHLHVQGFLDGSSDIDGSTSLEFEVEFSLLHDLMRVVL